MRFLLPAALLAIVMSAARAATPSPEEIVRRSVDAIKENWAEASKFTYLERDVDSKHGSPAMARTNRVLMIDGSPYNLVTAVNDQPLSPDEKAAEQRKLGREIEKRHNESDRERRHRIAKYEREQQRTHEMLQEMVEAFR